MVNPEQQQIYDALAQQSGHQKQVDRVLKVVLPIAAFLLCVICANLNVWSTLLTFVMMWIAFYATAIKHWPLWHWTLAILLFCLIDNILSYGSFNSSGFSRQFGTMFIFLGIFGVGRRYFDRWFMKKSI